MSKRVIVLIVVLLIFGFIFYKIFNELYQINFDVVKIKFSILPSIFLIAGAFYLNALMYVYILKGLGSHPDSVKNVIVINFLIQPVKYLPLGSVVNALTQGAVFGKLKGVNKVSAFFSPFLGLYVTILSGSTLFWILDFGIHKFGPMIHYLIGLGNLIGIFLISPKFIGYLFLIAKRVSKNKYTIDKIESNVFYKNIIIAFFISFIFWIIMGFGTHLAIQSIVIIKNFSSIEFIANYSFSSVIGYMLVIFPSGIGIREGALVYLFQNLPTPFPHLIALIARISWITAELINLASALIIGKSLLKGIKNELKK